MTTTESQTATTPLTPEQMKAAVQRFIDEALNKGDLSVVEDTYSEDLIDHDKGHPHLGTGVQEGKNEIMMYRTAFPDIHQTIHEKIAEGNTVMHRWTTTGTHRRTGRTPRRRSGPSGNGHRSQARWRIFTGR